MGIQVEFNPDLAHILKSWQILIIENEKFI